VWTHDGTAALHERRQVPSARERPGGSEICAQPGVTARRNEMVVWTSFRMATPIGEWVSDVSPIGTS
jgi:hypothetical protein